MPPSSEPPAVSFPNMGQAVLLLLATLGLQLAFGLIGGAVLALTLSGSANAMEYIRSAWFLLPIIVLSGGLALALGLRGTRETTGQFFPLRPVALGLLPAIVVTTLGLHLVLAEVDNCILHVVSLLSPAAKPPPDLLDLTGSPIGAALLAVIAAPVLEEYLFRGIILRGLLTHYNKAAAIWTSAILFGVFHLNLRQFVLAVALGLVFGWWYTRTRSLGPSLIGHMLFNGLTWGVAQWPDLSRTLHIYTGTKLVLHEPWWMILGGAALGALGLWRFNRSAPPETVKSAMPIGEREAIPPLLIEPPLL